MELRYPRGPVVFFGGSYLQGWRMNRFGEVPIVNCARAGLETRDLIDSFATVVAPLRPRAVVMWGFADLLRASREAIEDALARECANIEALVALAVEHGIEPVLMTELTLRPPETWDENVRAVVGWIRGKESYQDHVNDRIVRLNAFIRALAHREELLLLDVQALFSEKDEASRHAFFKPDGKNISAAGYAAISTYAAPVLGFLFGDEGTLPPVSAEEESLRGTHWVPAAPPIVRTVRQRG